MQRLTAFAVILTQAGIAVTGSIVRVTASGLGCPTWPRCFPGSFTPIGVSEVAVVHQAVEFGNRMLTFVVSLFAGLIVLAVIRARRRHDVLVYAWLMPGGTVLQAVIGGITVRTGLLWWTVAVHLLVSMLMVWLATVLYAKVSEPDDGIEAVRAPRRCVGSPPSAPPRWPPSWSRARSSPPPDRTRATRVSTARSRDSRSRSSRSSTCIPSCWSATWHY